MPFSLESLAALATIAGTIVSVLALLQSRAWLLLISLLIVCLSILAVLYARKQRLALDAASTVIEGHSIDALNIGNLRRRVNRTLFVQEVPTHGKDRWRRPGDYVAILRLLQGRERIRNRIQHQFGKQHSVWEIELHRL